MTYTAKFMGELFALGKEEGLKGAHLDLFVNFFVMRFKDSSRVYAREWAVRFRGGEPVSFMDADSLNVYNFVRTCMHQHQTHLGVLK